MRRRGDEQVLLAEQLGDLLVAKFNGGRRRNRVDQGVPAGARRRSDRPVYAALADASVIPSLSARGRGEDDGAQVVRRGIEDELGEHARASVAGAPRLQLD